MTVSECNLLEKIGATLSSCPYCGRDPKYRIRRKGAEREVYIKCRGCNARSGVMRCLPEDLLDALKDAVDAWNRRAADVVEVVHGRWSTRKITDDHTGSVSYSHFHDDPKCKYYYVDSGYGGHYYCPNCGAKMDGGADNAAD